ncbi:MAG: 4-hydroxy-3-methylbut-2-enyl diphosphate reductase [Deltaproteobacteria bacterium]|nr:MAG: 4-hydroxy-3-methylbut-2-enyl diphosphate reductase [Deltaproteobacteria bacterium]
MIMRVKIARASGFCMGVRRAVNIVLSASNKKNGKLFTFGPLIHNPQVLSLLKEKGIEIIDDPLKIPKKGRVVIRAHGVPPDVKEIIHRQGAQIIDATCPKVAKVHAIIKKEAERGRFIVIIGDPNHPEVKGLMGSAGKNVLAVDSFEKLSLIPTNEPITVVAQTTQNEEFFNQIQNEIKRKFSEVSVFNTICDSTHKRQREVKNLAKGVDAIVIVGGKNSANTRRLVEVAKETGVNAYHIESEKEIKEERLKNLSIVGVTAGASTPNWVISQVVEKLEKIKGRESSFFIWIKRFRNFLVKSNIFIAGAAGMLTFVSCFLQGFLFRLPFFFIAFGYIFSMHLINRLTDIDAIKFNDPARREFYERYGKVLIIFSLIVIVMILFFARFYLSFNPFLFLFAAVVIGLGYNFPFIPSSWVKKIGFSKIKEIPGSKTLFTAIGWGAIITFIPYLHYGGDFSIKQLSTFIVMFLVAFIRTATFDMRDIQGDLIVGKETFPIVLGEKRSKLLITMTILFLSIFLFLLSASSFIFPVHAIFFLAPIGYLALLVFASFSNPFWYTYSLEFFIDIAFYLMGFIALFLMF